MLVGVTVYGIFMRSFLSLNWSCPVFMRLKRVADNPLEVLWLTNAVYQIDIVKDFSDFGRRVV